MQRAAGLLVALPLAAGLKMSTCDASSMWVTLPMNRSVVEQWAAAQVGADHRQDIKFLDPPAPYAGMQGSQPMQIEFDSFYNCKTLLGLPYPSFQEVAIQAPYVSYQGKTLHFQPWALTNNAFGATAMELLCSSHELAAGSSAHPAPPGAWSQAATVSGGISLSLSGAVGAMQPSAALTAGDPVWKLMVESKKSNELVYKAPLGVPGFYCNEIVWDFNKTSAVAMASGALEITPGAKPQHDVFPRGEMAPFTGALRALAAEFGARGFAAYAVQTAFTANIGC